MDSLAGASAGSSFSVAIARTIAASSGASLDAHGLDQPRRRGAEHAHQVLAALGVAAEPEQVVGDAARAGRCGARSTATGLPAGASSETGATGPSDRTQVSLLPPPRCIDTTQDVGGVGHPRQPAGHHGVAVAVGGGVDARARVRAARAGRRPSTGAVDSASAVLADELAGAGADLVDQRLALAARQLRAEDRHRAGAAGTPA